jgi:hypothetical protein
VARNPPHLYVVSGTNQEAHPGLTTWVQVRKVSAGVPVSLARRLQEVLILLLNCYLLARLRWLRFLYLCYLLGRCGRQLGCGFPFRGLLLSFLRAHPFPSESEDGVSATLFGLWLQDSFLSFSLRHLALFFVLRLLARLSLPCWIAVMLGLETWSRSRDQKLWSRSRSRSHRLWSRVSSFWSDVSRPFETCMSQ